MPSTRATETMRFDPDYAVPPGETLREVIKALGMKQRELATRLEMAPKTVNQILQGRAPITPETALRLERVTRVRASFWNNREAIYQERSARLRQRASLEDDIQWLDEVPIGELVKRGQIAKGLDVASRLAAALTFFGVASVAAWKRLWESDAVPVELRSSTTRAIDVGALAAWIRIGELKAHAIDCEPYDRARFRLILDQVRGLAVPPPSESLLKARRLCAEAGVAFVVVPEIKGTRSWGATRWLSPTKAMLMLSLRYRSDDHFWFSFFHEAWHILNGPKKSLRVERENRETESENEKVADRFAAQILIPPRFESRLVGLKSRNDVIRFAREIGVSPGVVVGRLQHDREDFRIFRNLKRSITPGDIEEM